MVKAGAVHRRRSARVFGSSEDYDCVGGMEFLLIGSADNIRTGRNEDEHDYDEGQKSSPEDPVMAGALLYRSLVHP